MLSDISIQKKRPIISLIRIVPVVIMLCIAWGARAQAPHATGTDNGVVYINDLEDHTWTYYSGVDTSVDDGYYNAEYRDKIYCPNPRNVQITYTANGGSVSINESENSFVYYKTLTAGKTNGEYPYTVISNPFSKRPKDKGFGGWMIVNGHEYIKRADGSMATDSAILNLDEAITLVGLPYSAVNCTSAHIELQATWVDANVTYLDTDADYTYSTASGTHETNFLIIKSNYAGVITANSPVTIMMVEPDGSQDYRKYTFTGSIIPTTAGYTKIEHTHWKPKAGIDLQGQNFTIGRGMKMDGTARALYGTNIVVDVDQIMKVESGTFTTFDHYKVAPASIIKQWVTFGCDYDRAKNDNTKLTFTGAFIVGSGITFNANVLRNTELCRVYSLSGNFMTGKKPNQGASGDSYYISVTGASQKGCRYLEIQGGIWNANIAGGMDANTSTTSTFTFRMKGGIVKGAIYGAAQHATGNGTRTYVITGGTINGWVSGGANGTNFGNGTMNGASYIYVGGNAKVDSEGSSTIINRAVGGNVFGAGCGYCDISNSGKVSLGTNVVIADNAYIERGVYGGGSFGYCPTDKTANIYITGGTVDSKMGGVNATPTGTNDSNGNPNYNAQYDATVMGGVYGGACQNKGGTVNIYMTDGKINGGLYGGSNAAGTISGNVKMKILGGQVGTPTTLANIHGGGYGNNTLISKNVDITLGTLNQSTDGVVVYGDVYGGSALGNVNGTTANTTYHTHVTLNKGTINGSVYGGALGSDAVEANVYGPVTVKVYGGSVKSTSVVGSGGIYGGNNIKGSPQQSVTVDIYGTDPAASENEYAIYAVYGGGNKADYIHDNYPIVTVHNCDNSIEYVYGGGNAADVKATNVTIWGGNAIGNVFGGGNGTQNVANIIDNVSTKIYGGTIRNIYGGSNSSGTIGGTIDVTIDSQREGDKPLCNMLIGNVYGGGNKATSQVGNIHIGCTGDNGYIENVFGGANQANIDGDIALYINSGNIGNVFGGNNLSGNINGTITVTIGNDLSNDCGKFEIGNVYGGGNLAAYTTADDKKNYPVVYMLGGTVREAIYGGGLGVGATVTGNPHVYMTDGSVGYTEIVDGIPVVRGGNIFGGGNEAQVDGSTHVHITGGEVTNNVYGGGNKAKVTGKANVIIGQQ